MRLKRILCNRACLCAALLGIVGGALLWLAFPKEIRAEEQGQILHVKRFELAYRPMGDLLKARFTLGTGMAVEWAPSDDMDRDTLFRMADLFARYPSRMTVTMTEGAVTGMQMEIP